MTKLTGGPGWAFIPEDEQKGAKPRNPNSPKPKIRLEKRNGKAVTVVSGLHTYGADRLDGIARKLKTRLGAGGTVKNGAIEIQGDKAAQVKDWFEKQENGGR